ncbi:MAG: hypothetical protein ACKO34_07550 [Vampirovibrionales bacterium]
MIPSSPSSSSPTLGMRAYQFHKQVLERVPTQLAYASARTNEAWKNDIPELPGKSLLTPLVSGLLSLSPKVQTELKEFSYTPSFLRATIPHLPLSWSLIMFYGVMIPARMHSEYLRAPQYTDAEGQKHKDLRAIRDVLVRDMLSIGFFLFALSPVNQVFRQKMQNDGSMLTLGRDASMPLLRVMHRELNPLKELQAYGYPQLTQVYDYMRAPQRLASTVMTDAHQSEIATIFKKKLNEVHVVGGSSAQRQQFDGVRQQLKESTATLQRQQQQALHLFEAHLGMPDPTKLNRSATAAMQALSLLPTEVLTGQAHQGHPLPAEAFQQALHTALEQRQHQLRPLLQQAKQWQHHSHPEVQALGKAILNVNHTGDMATFKQLSSYANNHHGVLDTILKVASTDTRTVKAGYAERFDALHGLLHQGLDTLSEWHALQSLATGTQLYAPAKTTQGSVTLGKPSQTIQQLVGYLSTASHASEKTVGLAQQLEELTQTLRQQGAKVGGKYAGLLQLNSFKPSQLLIEHAKGLRSPADSMSFVFVATVMGFFPVWLNQVWSDTEFKIKQLNQAKPTSTSKS